MAEAASDDAALVNATLKNPGVVPPAAPPPVTLSHGAAGVTAVDQDSTFVTSVDCTRTLCGSGNEVDAAARENERLPAERSRSAENGRAVIWSNTEFV